MEEKDNNKDKGTNLSIYLDYELLEWIDEKVKERLFANRSHAVQACLAAYMQHIESNKDESNN
jgi:metal-responsive CopG/Arc/MetJ family transcriptional regulator